MPDAFLKMFSKGLVARRLLWNGYFAKGKLEEGLHVRLEKLQLDEDQFKELEIFGEKHLQPVYQWAWVDFLRRVRLKVRRGLSLL